MLRIQQNHDLKKSLNHAWADEQMHENTHAVSSRTAKAADLFMPIWKQQSAMMHSDRANLEAHLNSRSADGAIDTKTLVS